MSDLYSIIDSVIDYHNKMQGKFDNDFAYFVKHFCIMPQNYLISDNNVLFNSIFTKKLLDLNKDHNELILFHNKLYEIYKNISIKDNKLIMSNNSKYSFIKDSTVIHIEAIDSIFLSNSILIFINKYNYRINLFLNPVFLFDSDKNLIKYNSYYKSGHKDFNHSVIHIEIEQLSQIELKELKSNIKLIISYDQLINQDFLRMINKLNNFADYIKLINVPNTNIPSIISFISWLLDENYIFTGLEYIDYVHSSKSMNLGLLKKKGFIDYSNLNCNIDLKNKNISTNVFINFFITKEISIVYKNVPYDFISISIVQNGKVTNQLNLLGIFTLKSFLNNDFAYSLVQNRFEQLVNNMNILYQSRVYRDIKYIFLKTPINFLFFLDQEQLNEYIMLIIKSYREVTANVFLSYNKNTGNNCGYTLYFNLILPKSFYQSYKIDKINEYLVQILNASSIKHEALYLYNSIFSLYYYLNFSNKIANFIDLNILKMNIINIVDRFEDKLISYCYNQGTNKSLLDIYLHKYINKFNLDYQYNNTVSMAFEDMNMFESYINNDYSNQYSCIRVDNDSKKLKFQVYLRIYSSQFIRLNSVIPILSNMDIEVYDNTNYQFNINDKPLYLSILCCKIYQDKDTVSDKVISNFINTFKSLISKIYVDDTLNALFKYNIAANNINLLRTYLKYMYQILNSYDANILYQKMYLHHDIVETLLKYFYIKFNIKVSKRKIKIVSVTKELVDKLNLLSNFDDYHYFNLLYKCIKYTTRTNFFKDIGIIENWNIALKIQILKVIDIKGPQPLYEAYVNSKNMEGIHIRSSKIARGGLRWSNRIDDYRQEVLALMQTQSMKNVIIVPSGAKGGFIVKDLQFIDYDIVVEQYKIFISSLIEITDNIINNQKVTPKYMINYDKDDTYLVVAPDKGTATFSDIANDVSKKHNFWLGDAFASGGSDGYDHKKHGITARGAWESVKHHFMVLGIDINIPFSVIGIGDMSGDIFGNGMLLSNKIKLKAALNHIHIFIDPDPDPQISFNERKRLFNIPKSSWMDYNKTKISAGGGIFLRNSTSIELSIEIRNLLKIKKTAVSGNELIQYILKLKVDLLWSGGIGTYIKSSNESNLSINDKDNDSVRINACDLNCRVVAEGANISFTNKARIEYSRKPGMINTDAIDNSGGVDMSDYEVNIKILFQDIMTQTGISYDERNHEFCNITEFVIKRVLNNNYLNNCAISYNVFLSSHNVSRFQSLLKSILNKDNSISSYLISSLQDIKKFNSISRPEIAVILYYIKETIYNRILSTDIFNNSYFDQYFLTYFPSQILEKYYDYVMRHKLKRDITANNITNYVVNHLSLLLLYELHQETNVGYEYICYYYIIVDNLIDYKKIRNNIKNSNALSNLNSKHHSLMVLENFIKVLIYFFINLNMNIDSNNAIINLANRMKDILNSIYIKIGVFNNSIFDSQIVLEMQAAFVVTYISQNLNIDSDICFKLYNSLSSCLHIKDFNIYLDSYIPKNSIEHKTLNNIKVELLQYSYMLLNIIIKKYNMDFDKFKSENINFIKKNNNNFNNIKKLSSMIKYNDIYYYFSCIEGIRQIVLNNNNI